MKKRVLLICPHFMGYDEKIISCLNTKYNYDVDYIDSEKILKDIRKSYYSKNKIIKGILKTFSGYRDSYRNKMLESADNEYKKILSSFSSSAYDYVISVNGDGVSDNIYSYIKSISPGARFILYIWDDLKALFKQTHLKYFDSILSYNIEDCNAGNFKYLPVFTAKLDVKPKEKIYDISIVATANPGRIELAKKIYDKYKDIYNIYIYFYSPDHSFDFFCNDKPLKYDEYLNVLACSKSVLEVVRHSQCGPTTRVFDAIETKTKVITTNEHINNYPVYSSNILIIDGNIEIPSEFIRNQYNEIRYSPVYIDEWTEKILEE